MIYLLEDDESIRELVCYALNASELEATGFADTTSFWAALTRKKPELILLDIMLADETGLSILKKLRADPHTANIPVIMLTARSTEFDKVTALDAGADDYITKPFGVMELLARVKALLRRARTSGATDSTYYRAGKLTLSVTAHTVTVEGREIPLTCKEFDLLCLLFANCGTVLSRDVILRDVWGYTFDGENRTVDVHIRSLRMKLGEAGSIIETVRGIGYKIERTD